MEQLTNKAALRSYVAAQRRAGKTVSFVPTMGALHEGHLELVRQGLARADICIPYIFLNPKQFAPTEDLAAYPKTLEADLQKLQSVAASAVYLPTMQDVYPEGFSTKVTVGAVAHPLEGEHLPHFFEGVATVVAKMLLQCLPDIALFGEKDYQQLQVIKRLAIDLDIPVDIIGIPTVRDENGLALSSRNAYLSAQEYPIACRIHQTMKEMATRFRAGEDVSVIERDATARLLDSGFSTVDYCTIRDAETLLAPQQDRATYVPGSLRILVAAKLGKARLIDNLSL